MMGQQAYVLNNGDLCPNCRGDDVNEGTVFFEGECCYRTMYCIECQHDWTNLYNLGGYSDVNDDKGKRIPYPEDY